MINPLKTTSTESLEAAAAAARGGIIYAKDILDQMLHTFRNGQERGTSTYFYNMDRHWTWKKQEVTCFTGYPNHGKTEFLFQLSLIKNVNEGTRFGIFSPENMPADEVYNQLIHSFTGLSTVKGHSNQIDENSYVEAVKFIGKNFFIVYPDKQQHTLDVILDKFQMLKRDNGIEGVVVDPWNSLEQDESIRDDKQVRAGLTKCIRFAIDNDQYFTITAHPKSMPPAPDGSRPVPDAFSLAGGAMWNNRCHNIITVHRPNYHQDPADTSVSIHVNKIKKQKLVGLPGTCHMDYNRIEARYLVDGMSPFQNFKPVNDGSLFE